MTREVRSAGSHTRWYSHAGATLRGHLPGRGFVTGVFHITGGTLVSQGILLVSTMVIARLYSVDAIGTYSAIVALASTLVPLATANLTAAITPARSDADAARLARIALGLTLLALIVLEVAGAVAWALGVTPDSGSALSHWPWVPALVATYAVFGVFLATNLRDRDYKRAGWRPVVQNTATMATQIGATAITRTFVGLAIGDLVGRFLGIVLLSRSFRVLRTHTRGTTVEPGFWRRYSAVTTHYLPATLLDTFATTMWVLSASWWFGAQVAGYVGMTQRVLTVPIALIGAALGQVMMAEASHSRRSGEAIFNVRGISGLLMAVAVITGLVLLALGPFIFRTFLGPEWEQSGHLARMLCLTTAVGLIWNPLSALFVAFERWRTFLVLATIRVGLSLVFGWAAYQSGASWQWTITALALGGTIGQGIGMISLRRVLADARSSQPQPPPTPGA